MILLSLVLIFVIVLVAIAFASSAKIMNYYTLVHSFSILLLSLFLFTTVNTPLVLLKNRYFLLDALSVYEIFITGIIFFLAAIYAKGYVECLIKDGHLSKTNVKLFYLTYNSLLFTAVLAFISNNLSLLWVFAEITTLLSAVLIVILNTKENIIAAMKYVFLTTTAMLFSFIGLLLLYAASHYTTNGSTLNWDDLVLASQQIAPPLLLFIFVFLFIGFAAKSGIAPFHTWLPPVYAKSPSDVSVLLSGAIHNIGLYAIIRIYSFIAPTSTAHTASMILLTFGVLTVGIASFSMLVRSNVKKLIAFSSVENIGFMLIGIAVGNIFWVLYYTFAHALVKALLFFSAGIIHRQYDSINIEDINNVLKLQPLAAVGLMVGSIAIIGVPLFPLFVPKFFLLASLAKVSLLTLLLVLLFLLIAVGSYVWGIMRLVTQSGKATEPYPIYTSMKIPVLTLIVLSIILGVYFPPVLRHFLDAITVQLGFGG